MAKHTLPAFTPVPRLKQRSNGWTAEVQRAFIEALADTGSVRSACLRVRRADHGAYLLRRHPQAGEFRKAWQAALDIGMQRIEDVAMDRALNGVEVPVYSYGKLVGTRRVYNDRLLMFMLRNRAPKRFNPARALSAMDEMLAKRLKQQWRQEWEDEREAQNAVDEDAVWISLGAKIDAMRARQAALQSPRTRELYDAYKASEAEDHARGFPQLEAMGGEDGGAEEYRQALDGPPEER